MQAHHNDPALKIQCLELMADHQFDHERLVGADVSRVSWQFLDWLLGKLPSTDREDVSSAIEQVRTTVLQPLARGETVDKETIDAAADAADTAADAAADAADYAADYAADAVVYAVRADAAVARATADAACVAAAADADCAAADADACVAAAADADACVAAAAARAASVYEAAADEAADEAARTAHKRQADKLIELLETAM